MTSSNKAGLSLAFGGGSNGKYIHIQIKNIGANGFLSDLIARRAGAPAFGDSAGYNSAI